MHCHVLFDIYIALQVSYIARSGKVIQNYQFRFSLLNIMMKLLKKYILHNKIRYVIMHMDQICERGMYGKYLFFFSK